MGRLMSSLISSSDDSEAEKEREKQKCTGQPRAQTGYQQEKKKVSHVSKWFVKKGEIAVKSASSDFRYRRKSLGFFVLCNAAVHICLLLT